VVGLKKIPKGRVIVMLSVCCGNWNNAASAGLFYRNFNNNRSNDNNNASFRASDYISNPETEKTETGEIGMTLPVIKNITKSAKSMTDNLSYSYFLNIDNLILNYITIYKINNERKTDLD
jgi:hypothetical protein